MKIKESIGIIIAGCAAGVVNGLFGAGGGLILVPMLSRYADIEENQVFPCSVSIILPLSVISIFTNITYQTATSVT